MYIDDSVDEVKVGKIKKISLGIVTILLVILGVVGWIYERVRNDDDEYLEET